MYIIWEILCYWTKIAIKYLFEYTNLKTTVSILEKNNWCY